jgi:predicted AlkP superfamily pyrophosphatase or phosphodiesterase
MRINKRFLLLITLQCFFLNQLICARYKEEGRPKLTIVLVVDQFAYHYIPKLGRHFKYGLKYLFENGVVYNKAYHPHGVPETTPGHHAISTGTLPKDHGAVGNDWLDMNGHPVAYADDPDYPSLTSQEGTKGYSSRKTRVDNLSDQFVFKSCPGTTCKVFSMALKNYPAISMAGKMGKAFWLDPESGEFSSSTAYFNALPDWVIEFNQKKKAEKLKAKIWDLVYSQDSEKYNFPYIRNYDYAGFETSMIGVNSDKIINNSSENKYYTHHKTKNSSNYYMFMKSPFSSKLLLKFAKRCIDANLSLENDDKMILWVSLSNLDLLCHFYGPHCIETIDLIYHIDKQIKKFIEYVSKRVGEEDYLVVFTADHGICPIPEIMQKQGFHLAKRISAGPLVNHLNEMIKEKFGVEKIVLDFEPTYFRLDRKALEKFDDTVKRDIYDLILGHLRSVQGIKNAWTFDELANSTFEPCQLENFYKNQLYIGRSGDIICQPEPYCQITKYPTGTSHLSPYEYDTHVPLVIYQKGKFEKKVINDKVWIPQLPVTLAKILGVAGPSASTYDPLPGLKI